MLKHFGKFEHHLLKYSVAALIMAVPLYPKFPFINIPGTYVAIRLEDFLIALAGAFWFVFFVRNWRQVLASRLTQAILAFLVIGLLSLVSAIFVTKTVLPHLAALHWLRRGEYLLPFFIASAAVRSREDIKFYIQVLGLTVFLVVIYGAGQKFFGLPVISTMNVEFAKGIALLLQEGARVNSTFAGHYDLAAFMVVILNLVAAVTLALRRKLFVLLGALLAAASFWMLLLSASRISFAAYLVSITFTLWLAKRRLLIAPILVLSLIGMLGTTGFASRYLSTWRVNLEFISARISKPGEVTISGQELALLPTPTPKVLEVETTGPQRIVIVTPGRGTAQAAASPISRQLEGDRSASIRFDAEWPRALRSFYKNPLLGTGYSSITLATDNDYLRALGEVGLLGFTAFVIILVLLLQEAASFVAKASDELLRLAVLGMMGATLGFLLNAAFIDVFEASKTATMFWLLAGLTIGITRLPAKADKK